VAQRPDKTLVILSGEIKTPPLSTEARREAGFFLRRLQQGELISLPHSRPMTKAIGPRCHELRIQDEDATWRIMYRIDTDELPDHRRLLEENAEDAGQRHRRLQGPLEKLG
jgi:hypothetical protein